MGNRISRRGGHQISPRESLQLWIGVNQKSLGYVRVIRSPVQDEPHLRRTRLGYSSLWCTLTEQNTVIYHCNQPWRALEPSKPRRFVLWPQPQPRNSEGFPRPEVSSLLENRSLSSRGFFFYRITSFIPDATVYLR